MCKNGGYCLWLQVPQDVLQKLLETLQENHYQEDEQFLGAVMPRLGNYDLRVALQKQITKPGLNNHSCSILNRKKENVSYMD